jgi:patatin-like phospholipase/acyl hydrolase
MSQPFRVLSLDGGGIRGVFTVSYLAALERGTNDGSIASKFDLIAGTSTGGIIALGLAFGIPPAEILDMYRMAGPSIFPDKVARLGFIPRLLRLARGPLYDPLPLRSELERLFGEATLADMKLPVVVPAVNVVRGGIHVFKSLDDPRLKFDRRARVVDVALATSAAPFYFPAHHVHEGRWIDGGLWANSPVAVAAAEAVGFMGVEAERVRLLSVGTTASPFHLGDSGSLKGFFAASKHIDVANIAMAPQMMGALGLARTMLGGRDRVMRIEREVAKDRFALDRASDIPELEMLGIAEARESTTRVSEFLQFLPDQLRRGVDM